MNSRCTLIRQATGPSRSKASFITSAAGAASATAQWRRCPTTANGKRPSKSTRSRWTTCKPERKPREIGDEGLTVGHLRDRLLTAKSRALDAGEITVRTYSEYRRTVELLIGAFGEGRLMENLAGDDFEQLRADLAKHSGPVRLGNETQRVRTVFK